MRLSLRDIRSTLAADKKETDYEIAFNLTTKGRDGVVVGVSSFDQLESNLHDRRREGSPSGRSIECIE